MDLSDFSSNSKQQNLLQKKKERIPMKIKTNGTEIEITDEMLEQIHRQEKIKNGRSVLENYLPNLTDTFSDEELIHYAETLEEIMMENNGPHEISAITNVFGENVFSEDEYESTNFD